LEIEGDEKQKQIILHNTKNVKIENQAAVLKLK
jgi:hypothetical protein